MKSLIVLFAIVIAATLAAPQGESKPFHTIDFNRYWTQEEIDNYIEQLNNEYPQFIEVEVIGRTSEDREIRAIRVTNEDTLTDETPAVFVTAGLNSRDWIATMSAIDIIHELVEHNSMFEHLTDGLVWYILPVANPDGYIFSFGAGQRGWFKNRRVSIGTSCMGVNLDRNFNQTWGVDLRSDNDPCSDNFRGLAGDSEEETRGIQTVADAFGRRLRAYVTLKSAETAASAIAFPFAHSNEAFTEHIFEQRAVANMMADAIFLKTGNRWRTGSEINLNFAASGTSADYAAGVDNVPIVATMFLPRGNDVNGWDVPAFRINGIVDEVFFGIEVMAEYVTRM